MIANAGFYRMHLVISLTLASLFCLSVPIHAQKLSPKKEYAATLLALADALLARQAPDSAGANAGGIWCAHCQVWHTRAAEAVYPFTMAALITGNKRYTKAAQQAAAWLFRQQQPNGSWKETPEEWTGTTTDQLLMLLLSYEKLQPQLSHTKQQQWLSAMDSAAAYLYRVMSPEFASINYVATTTATLAKAGVLLHKPVYTQKAMQLARRTIAKMDEDGFLNGEGGRSHGSKMGVDLGYDMEMSLWGLGLYARLTADTLVDACVKKGLKNHLYFIYPDGSLDGSWGIRSNKWTGYGSATSDGCQVLFSLYADEDPRYATAGLRNLQFLRKNITASGLIGYGPQHAAIFNTPPCIYPTFAKAKNLAMAFALETKETRTAAPLPADSSGWMKIFPTLDLVEVRTQEFMATITAYRYKDPAGAKGKYMFRPDGGAISHLWAAGHGFMSASSPTIYTRPEPMSFPEAPGVLPLTPRIEYTDSTGYFTNLFEFDGRLSATEKDNRQYVVTVSGELKDKNQLGGGVGYRLDYLFADSMLQKEITLTYHDTRPVVHIIEPLIHDTGMTFQQKDDRTIFIRAGEKQWVLKLLSGHARWIAGREAARYWTPYPALKAWPLELEITPGPQAINTSVTYSLQVLNTQADKIND
ncbi:hypothetical protein F0L74_23840 [Chitinophaga agrisoli]|uniref:Uncharacterized protein n=1 Tax=Chitinophaga agrisoli TaxID=2607653 RepID=A0A5B2VLP0_9BACT|nr:hypothetical protein [Chitinophaga agrisoli]KAA2239242.1 hypothetical protein F0L74_23840 [Chitinophaga agrisoli]